MTSEQEDGETLFYRILPATAGDSIKGPIKLEKNWKAPEMYKVPSWNEKWSF